MIPWNLLDTAAGGGSSRALTFPDGRNELRPYNPTRSVRVAGARFTAPYVPKSTFGAVSAPGWASKYGFGSNPSMPAKIAAGKRRTRVL